jgi:regulatory protein
MDEKQRSYIKQRVVELLSRRGHSELEIRNKMSRWATEEEISFAIKFAKSFRLIPSSPEEETQLSEQFAQSYHRKNLGALKIQQKLTEKGLPKVKIDPELELKKATHLLATRRLRSKKALTKPQLIRYLLNKGFSLEIALKAFQTFQTLDRGVLDEPTDTKPDS